MGYDCENAGRWMGFDCETVAIANAQRFVKAPGNMKDLDKIAAAIEEKAKKAATDIDLARIVALAMQSDTEEEPSVLTAPDERAERALLERFWARVESVQGQRLVGFNIRQYDLPLVMRRSQLLGVPYVPINLDRYRQTQLCDLQDVLTFGGILDPKKLIVYCELFGIVVEDKVTGADVAQCIADDRWDLVEHHASADVVRAVKLAARLGCIDARLAEAA